MRTQSYFLSIVLSLFIFANGQDSISADQAPSQEEYIEFLDQVMQEDTLDMCLIVFKEDEAPADGDMRAGIAFLSRRPAFVFSAKKLQKYKEKQMYVLNEKDLVDMQFFAMTQTQIRGLSLQFEQYGDVIELLNGISIELPSPYRCLALLAVERDDLTPFITAKEDEGFLSEELLDQLYNPGSQPLQQEMPQWKKKMLRFFAWCLQTGVSIGSMIFSACHKVV